MKVERVRVRMYKKLLGDCFLIILEGKDGRKDASAHILIDCGVLQGTRGSKDLMMAAVRDIYDTAGEKGLDLVVVTHEHHDHICGFKLADDIFAERKFGDLWMAWTDDPDDPDGRELQEKYGQAYAALAGMAARFGVASAVDDFETEAIMGLAGFSGPFAVPLDDDDAAGGSGDGMLGVSGRRKTVRGSRKIYLDLKSWAEQTRYLSPGDVMETPGAIGLKTYVLGPPRDRDLLSKALPSSGENAETYFALAGEFLDAIEPGGTGPAGGTADEAAICREALHRSPFSARYHWRSFVEQRDARDDGAATRLLHRRYFAGQSDQDNFSCGEPLAHRRIDDAMRSTFSSLSLKMNNNTNNTSLVLAFELPGDGGTMIFAADAQVGNWLSWGKVRFRNPESGKELPVTSEDLLAAARLYKVGHHGSHNATLSEKGLERMIHKDLVAMIPTDEEFAKKQSGTWEMPDPHLNEALTVRTRGRILRGDKPAAEAIAQHQEIAGKASSEAFAKRVADGDLFVEFTVYDRALENADG
ncbi:ComEC/Rec2 family competence protein [Novosphingobium beihaiensis]|uniref:Metallo-beta-lactamase superfamily protein n=1 Tax=Novosphingobium beihaiensis TaxID=2930389 RepID=A0ABT0BNH2_9SPHN|nr:hypothetical protein [Novosphingobium beihaiensis]MCJ2186510.1 hypothetical protein [Novosphingobium beihaiensis]